MCANRNLGIKGNLSRRAVFVCAMKYNPASATDRNISALNSKHLLVIKYQTTPCWTKYINTPF